MGKCEGLENVIHSNLFWRTPDLCTSTLGVGEGVLWEGIWSGEVQRIRKRNTLKPLLADT